MRSTMVFIVLSVLSSFTLHKYFVSLSQIELNSETNRIEIASKYFTDDLIRAIEEASLKKVNFGNGEQDSTTLSLVTKYFEKHIQLNINDSLSIPMHLLGYEDGIKESWIYLESDSIPAIVQELRLTNSSLFNRIEEQKHMIHFKFKDFQSSDILGKDSQQATFSLL